MLNIDNFIKYIRLVEEDNEFDISLIDNYGPGYKEILITSTDDKKLVYYYNFFKLIYWNKFNIFQNQDRLSILIKL